MIDKLLLKRRSRRGALGGFAAMACLAVLGLPSTAHAMSVSPLVVDLTPGAGAATVEVTNLFKRPLAIEVTPTLVSFTESGIENGEATKDLIVFPPQAIIAPGRTQVIRLQYVGAPPTQESRHFFAKVSQLPVQTQEGDATIQVLYAFNVLVSAPLAGVPANLQVVAAKIVPAPQGDGLEITFENTAANYGYVPRGRLRLAYKTAAGVDAGSLTLSGPQLEQMFGTAIVGPKQRRTFRVALPQPAGGPAVTAEFVNAGQ